MVGKNKETKISLNWKNWLIVILVLLLFWIGWKYFSLSDEYDLYKENVQMASLNNAVKAGQTASTQDCFDRGTVECYAVGTLQKAKDEVNNYLLTHDCYERGKVKCYDSNMYCYSSLQSSSSCQEGYRLACING